MRQWLPPGVVVSSVVILLIVAAGAVASMLIVILALPLSMDAKIMIVGDDAGAAAFLAAIVAGFVAIVALNQATKKPHLERNCSGPLQSRHG